MSERGRVCVSLTQRGRWVLVVSNILPKKPGSREASAPRDLAREFRRLLKKDQVFLITGPLALVIKPEIFLQSVWRMMFLSDGLSTDTLD